MKRPRRSTDPLYLLWAIREGVKTRRQLEGLFGRDKTEVTRALYELDHLEQAGFIVQKDDELEITPLFSKIQPVLGISLTELATYPNHSSMRVSPVFPKPDLLSNPHDYKYDIFVLMPFDQELKPIFEDHIAVVAKKLKMTIARADDFFSASPIMDEIWSAIVRSEVIIADCTGRNPNVFYEIGIAHTLGKSVVLITQNPEDVPFDLRQRRFITYEYTPRGIKQFEESLHVTLVNIRYEEYEENY